MKPRPSQQPGGFSLVEVAIALAIVAFMVIPLVALAIHAKDAIRESTQESQAAAVASNIFSSLSLSSADSGILLETGSRERERIDGRSFESFELARFSRGGELYLLLDDAGRVIEEIPSGNYTEGYVSGGALIESASVVGIRFDTLGFPALSADSLALGPGLFLVTVSVEYPAAAPAGNRKAYPFTAYLNLSNSREAPTTSADE